MNARVIKYQNSSQINLDVENDCLVSFHWLIKTATKWSKYNEEFEQNQIIWNRPNNVRWYRLIWESVDRTKLLILFLIWGEIWIKTYFNSVIFSQFLWSNSFMACFLCWYVFWYLLVLDIFESLEILNLDSEHEHKHRASLMWFSFSSIYRVIRLLFRIENILNKK